MNIDTIKKRGKGLRIWLIISLIMRIANLISVIVTYIFISSNLLDNTFSSSTWIAIFFFIFERMFFTFFCIVELNKVIIGNHQSLDDPLKCLRNAKWYCIGSIALVAIALLVGLCAHWSFIAYAIGYTSLGSITFIVGSIMVFCLLGDIDYENNIRQYGSEEAYIDALLTEKENKEIAKQQSEHEQSLQKEHEKTAKLLENIGTKFFVKYYDKLQNWSVPDIIDEIEENYSEESKLNRIKKAKKLFELGLNTTALEIISKSKNKTTDDNTREKALQLLNQAKCTDD